ncbi:MAG: amidohydrolase, partial [Chitinophagaceae bacterium]
MKRYFLILAAAILLSSCSRRSADLIVVNGQVYTVNNNFDVVEAFAVKDGKIVATGTTAQIQKAYDAAETVDAGGKPVYPGFIDGHAHFYGYGESLQAADLFGATSWQEVIRRLTEFAKTHPDGWLKGRGWDQNLWPGKQFPNNEALNKLFPDRPVIITRV